MEKKNIFDIIEGYYLANLLVHLNQKGLFRDKKEKKSIKKYFPDRQILDFLVQRSDIIAFSDEKSFSVKRGYSSYIASGFHIEKFLGAYGRFDLGGETPFIAIDEKQFAGSFQKADAFHDFKKILAIFSELRVNCLLDLGCGTGRLIREFCSAGESNIAIGIDQNPYSLEIADAQVRKCGMTDRITLAEGNVLDFDAFLSRSQIKSIGAVYGSSIFNEFFQPASRLTKFLRKLKRYFPGKYLIISDYYGIFNSPHRDDPSLQHNYVHDVMQILTKQGVPGDNYEAWNAYYEAANCELIKVCEGTHNGVNWFIHVLKLQEKDWIF